MPRKRSARVTCVTGRGADELRNSGLMCLQPWENQISIAKSPQGAKFGFSSFPLNCFCSPIGRGSAVAGWRVFFPLLSPRVFGLAASARGGNKWSVTSQPVSSFIPTDFPSPAAARISSKNREMAAIQAPHHVYAEPRDGDVSHQPPEAPTSRAITLAKR